jgi:hypothetical protein
MAYNSNVLPESDSETKRGTNNNLYQGPAEKSLSNDNVSDGMGIARPAAEKEFERFPGSLQSEQNKLKDREIGRFDELRRVAMGRNIPITNAGIVLNEFGGEYGEQRREDGQLKADREQPRGRPASQE